MEMTLTSQDLNIKKSTDLIMALSIRDSGRIICGMEKALKCGLTVPDTRDFGAKTKLTAKESSGMWMETSLRENGRTIKRMGTGSIPI